MNVNNINGKNNTNNTNNMNNTKEINWKVVPLIIEEMFLMMYDTYGEHIVNKEYAVHYKKLLRKLKYKRKEIENFVLWSTEFLSEYDYEVTSDGLKSLENKGIY